MFGGGWWRRKERTVVFGEEDGLDVLGKGCVCAEGGEGDGGLGRHFESWGWLGVLLMVVELDDAWGESAG